MRWGSVRMCGSLVGPARSPGAPNPLQHVCHDEASYVSLWGTREIRRRGPVWAKRSGGCTPPVVVVAPRATAVPAEAGPSVDAAGFPRSRERRLGEAEFLDARTQLRAGEPELPGCLRLVVAGARQRLDDHLALGCIERTGAHARRRR